MTMEEVSKKNREYTFASWKAQKTWNPVVAQRAKGVYLYDENGNKYLSWASELINVNLGHGHEKLVKAIQDQIAELCYVAPSVATGPRGRLGELLKEISPHNLSKSFFTTAGTDAIENAIKIARLYTGKRKIITRFRSYHGATQGSMTAGGDARRLANEPGMPGVVRIHSADPYRSPIYRNRTSDEGDEIVADLLEQTIVYEGPQYIAGILLEGYSGTSGIYQPGPVFWKRVQEIKEKYNLLLIVDEVMSGFGRTGKWFGIDHYPWVKPDIMCLAKGITSGYIPFGAVVVTDTIAEHFEDNVLWAGLTYSGHTIGCTAAVATIETMQEENIVERAEKMGSFLTEQLNKLKDKHPSVGQVRGTGMLQVLDLVKNQESREPMGPFNGPMSEAMQKVAESLSKDRLTTFVKFSWIFCCPPLISTEEEIMEGIEILDRALTIADQYYEG